MTRNGHKFGSSDWRDSKAYDYTAKLTRLGWAWEFLRRNPQFCDDLARLLEDVEQIESDIADAMFRTKVELSRWGVLFRGLIRS